MLIYLVQHADANKEDIDPSRSLSGKGLQDIKVVASYVSRLNIKVYKIFHSNKLRAKQTAEILSENLKPTKGFSEVDGLAPLDDPNIWADRLKDIPDDIILVGHLPHLGKLASLLLSVGTDKNIISFKMAGIVCLKKNDAGEWSLQWMLTPEIVTGEKNSCDGL
ncbi:MAG: phosphohistidine phosphatase SixA [Nitrospirae bacterium RBG_13_39_12]|nr:MAG: phosphohistidine phosphatase SixA [Nitrospirae bacterium RBG_13_39_12]